MASCEYVCDECRHHFGTPDDTPRDHRAVMCPSCGCSAVTIAVGPRPRPIVMRAKTPAAARGDWRPGTDLPQG